SNFRRDNGPPDTFPLPAPVAPAPVPDHALAQQEALPLVGQQILGHRKALHIAAPGYLELVSFVALVENRAVKGVQQLLAIEKLLGLLIDLYRLVRTIRWV
ncbi:hypothetical protein EQH57_1052, partial [Dictyocoela roeselum]